MELIFKSSLIKRLSVRTVENHNVFLVGWTVVDTLSNISQRSGYYQVSDKLISYKIKTVQEEG